MYDQNKAPEYSWNASSAGHGGHEHQGYDQMSGPNTYGDHATGSPAIKEDGCVFPINFPISLVFAFPVGEG